MHALLSDGLEAMIGSKPIPVAEAGHRVGLTHGWRQLLGRDLFWLIGAAVVFTSSVIAFTPLHQGFSWDEVVYVSQISQHAPSMPWAAERARGMPLLVAPVTLLTGSPTVLRLYLALLAGLGLFLGLLAWRGLRAAWVLALAGVVFGSLWVAQAEAPLVFPNFWAAIGGISGIGLFLQAVKRRGSRRYVFILLTAATAFTALMRPADALFLFAPLIVAVVVKKEWRSLALFMAMVSGLLLGLGEWLVEAYLYFGGLFARLSGVREASGGTGLHLLNGFRVLNGRSSWSYPGILAWWVVFLVLAGIGVWAVSQSDGWLFALVPVVCALSVYILYSFPNLVSARYLLPAWLLLAIPVADGIAKVSVGAFGRPRWALVMAAITFVLIELVSQHIVLAKEIESRQAAIGANGKVTSELFHLKVRPPCVVTSDSTQPFTPVAMPAAYHLDCSYAWDVTRVSLPSHSRIVVIEGRTGRPFSYARDWPDRRLRTSDGFVQIWTEPRRLDHSESKSQRGTALGSHFQGSRPN
jgi:hypothetical protein